MSQLLFANNAVSNLAGPLTTTATTLNVTAGTGAEFPVPGNGSFFKLTLQDAATGLLSEIVHVTAVAGDAFTIVRAQEGTTALNWLSGDLVGNLVTAGTLQAFAQTSNLPATVYTGTDTGSANALQVTTLVPPLSGASAGEVFVVTKSATAGANTGPATLAVGTNPTAYSIVYNNGDPLAAGDVPAGSTIMLYFTGGVFQVLSGRLTAPVHVGENTGSASAITATLSPAIPVYQLDHLYNIGVGSSAATGPATANFNNLGAKPVVRNDGTPLVAGDFPANGRLLTSFDGTSFRGLSLTPSQVVALIGQNAPIVLPSGISPTLYVRTDGSDSNNGLANTPAGAFATIAAAITSGARQFYFPGGLLTIQLGNTGTYAAPNITQVGSGTVVIQGDTANQDSYVVSGVGPSAGSSGIAGANACSVVYQGLTLQNAGTNNNTGLSSNGGNLTVNYVTFANSVSGNTAGILSPINNATITIGPGCKISGSATFLINSVGNGVLSMLADVTMVGSPNYSGTVCICSSGGRFQRAATNPNFLNAGGVTGQRYNVFLGSTINTNGAGPNFFPGNAAGVSNPGTGGYYA